MRLITNKEPYREKSTKKSPAARTVSDSSEVTSGFEPLYPVLQTGD